MAENGVLTCAAWHSVDSPRALLSVPSPPRHHPSRRTRRGGAGLGKPTGVRGVQPWRKIGDPDRANESELEFVNEFTRSRMTLDYQMTQGGQAVYYHARWVSTRGETSLWRELVSATVVKYAFPLQHATRWAT